MRKNPLTSSDENLYMASVGKKDTQRQKEVIEHMMKRNTTISRQDIMIVLDLLEETVMDLVLNGFPVITNLFKARISIRGGFTSFDDEFDKGRHKMCLNLNPSKKFREEMVLKAALEKTEHRSLDTEISRIYDYNTRRFTTNFAAGCLIGVHGKNLLPEEGDPQIMLNREGSEEMVLLGPIMDVSDRMVMGHIPRDLEGGEYHVILVREEGKKKVHTPYDKTITIA